MNRDQADVIIQRTGMLAMLYYPQIHNDDRSFELDDEVRWCLEDATGLTGVTEAMLRDIIGRAIVDPSGQREQLSKVVYGLVTAPPAETTAGD